MIPSRVKMLEIWKIYKMEQIHDGTVNISKWQQDFKIQLLMVKSMEQEQVERLLIQQGIEAPLEELMPETQTFIEWY